ncbi:MAG: bile acid:sodium symporter family protein [Nitratireductor sp.]|jgi:BASS family bile acid:Na+ symporter|nr:bile acid:sodium symporter family protein [Nitratireductor sp.]
MNYILTTLLPFGLAVIMFSLGLGLVIDDFLRIARRPLAFTVGAVNQLVFLPLVAFGFARLSGLPGELAFGIMILAFCPGGVTSNLMTKFAKGDVALAVSLTAVISLVAIFTVPPLVAFTSAFFLPVEAPPIDVASLGIKMALITAVPASAGMIVNAFMPSLARRAEPVMANLSAVLFVVIVGVALYTNWDAFITNLPRLGPVLAAIIVVMFAIGYVTARITGLSTPAASAIAIETGTQNATLGITIGALVATGGDPLPNFSLPAGVYGILMYFLVVPFIYWRRMAER